MSWEGDPYLWVVGEHQPVPVAKIIADLNTVNPGPISPLLFTYGLQSNLRPKNPEYYQWYNSLFMQPATLMNKNRVALMNSPEIYRIPPPGQSRFPL